MHRVPAGTMYPGTMYPMVFYYLSGLQYSSGIAYLPILRTGRVPLSVFIRMRLTLRSTTLRFEDLVNNHKDMVFNLLFRLSGDYHLSQDLFQETFIKVYRNINNFQRQSKPSTWIYSIAVNVFRDHARKREPLPLTTGEPTLRTDEGNPETQLIRSLEKEEIQKRIKDLRESIRIPLVLYYIEGLTVQQISEITGRSPSDIKVSLHRARKKLRQGFENERRLS